MVYIPPIVRIVLILCICITAAHGLISGRWEPFIRAVPLAIPLIPGYLDLLPRGGMKHGRAICYCPSAEPRCELQYWSEVGQKLFLIVPLALTEIFLSALLTQGYVIALADTAKGVLLFCALFGAYAFGVYWLVRIRKV